MMQTNKTAIIADDFTGAGDAGVHFARFGRKTELLLRRDALSGQADGTGDVALSSETRFLAPEDAASVMNDLVRQCRAAGFARIFKKIDSTMRGNPGSEIAAALAATGHAAALICPAMPKTGRTCVDGAIFVDGTPLHLSDIGSDPFHPLKTASIADLLRAQTKLPIGWLGIAEIEAGDAALKQAITSLVAKGTRLIIADAVKDRHLDALARQIEAGDLLPVGAGGFAEALADALTSKGEVPRNAVAVSLDRPMVAIVGSMAEASRRQADHAENSGRFVTIELGDDMGPDDIDGLCAERLSGLSESRPNVLLRAVAPVRGREMRKEEGERVAERLGYAAALVCRLAACRTVYSTGGSTSMAVARAIGIEAVDLVDEILPGTVAGSCRMADSSVAWFVSKAGGFGDADLLTEVERRCGAQQAGANPSKSENAKPHMRRTTRVL